MKKVGFIKKSESGTGKILIGIGGIYLAFDSTESIIDTVKEIYTCVCEIRGEIVKKEEIIVSPMISEEGDWIGDERHSNEIISAIAKAYNVQSNEIKLAEVSQMINYLTEERDNLKFTLAKSELEFITLSQFKVGIISEYKAAKRLGITCSQLSALIIDLKS